MYNNVTNIIMYIIYDSMPITYHMISCFRSPVYKKRRQKIIY